MTPITFTSHGDKIAGNLFAASKSTNLAFLLIQGWIGHQNLAAAQALADLGFTSMTYDMLGNGDSKGDLAKLSRADFLGDAIIAYDYLKQQVDEQAAIGVVGCASPQNTVCFSCTHCRALHCLVSEPLANSPSHAELRLTGEASRGF